MIGVECPHCGNKQPHNFIKQISIGTSFQLKGDGWYADGYSSKKGND
jgi:predicted nucleic acid-binding Zn ribbon protein